MRHRTIGLALAFIVALPAYALPPAAAFLPAVASAQTGLEGFGADLSLEIFPHYPAPGDAVRVVAHSTFIPLSEATLTWYRDGKKILESAGGAEMTFTAGALGSETAVSARAERGEDSAQASANIRPTEMDLLWESDSYIPPFFRGRALPSAGTTLRLQAIPRFKQKSGALVSSSDIVFTWKRNGYVIETSSGRGRAHAYIPSPALFGTDTISVEARSGDGLYVGEASATIRSEEPRLVLYEDHPLFGIKYYAALGAQNVIRQTEVALSATPYYAEASTPDDGALNYEWLVNGQPIALDPDRPSALTLNAAGSSGIAFIELALSHATNFYLNTRNAWRVTLLGGGNSAENPFGAQ